MKTCFWGHKWGKWKDVKLVRISYLFNEESEEVGQERECLRCGKKQIRAI